jgi:tRNA1(Val) A37 N6-methylase TrmN6
LAIDRADAKVLDLACGSGTLLVAAYRRKRELLLREKGEFTFEDHKRFLEQDLTGIDIMPFAAHMAVVHLALQALAAGHEAEKVRIAVWDSTELEPGQTIPAISRELKAAYRRPTLEVFFEGKPPVEEAYVEKGAVTLEGIGGEQIPLEKADVVIMNPPFTRQERLPDQYKNILERRFQKYKTYTHGQIGLHGYFLLLADKFVKDGGRIAFVLPATILRLGSFESLRRFLAENYEIEFIITTTKKAAFSENVAFREILFIAKKLSADRKTLSKKCAILNLKELPRNTEDARQIALSIKDYISKQKIVDDKIMTLKLVSQREIEENIGNLFALLPMKAGVEESWNEFIEKGSKYLTSVKEYLKDNAKIFEGLHLWKGDKLFHPSETYILYDSSLAIKNYDIWSKESIKENTLIAINRITQEKLEIPLTCVTRGLRRLSGIKKIDVSEQLDYVITDDFEDSDKFFHKKTKEEISSFLCKRKKAIHKKLCNICIARRFDISAVGTSIIAFYSSQVMAPANMFLGIKEISLEDAKLLALWFNSSFNLVQLLMKRKETRGAFMQLNKYIVKDFVILDPNKLTAEDKYSLLKIFDVIKAIEFPCVLEQLRGRFWARVEIDRAVLKVLGFNEQETNQILDYLYPALTKEIEQLKTLMQG